ncbi:hypothetical protein SK854_05320 [Lentzea sp. BCCO 10_0061]|uniref:Uncharacterized protein n=1 Tax=Lentzea sokolovensis TaxID=3095429 RepID=A0ABU4UPU9_9PSEU|nr:hypothetical protein [Lentzea sp. BCCO 10_0061]MDX8141522.1 hypothetical protein [Lentzea sp. BCCO 10_0061]
MIRLKGAAFCGGEIGDGKVLVSQELYVASDLGPGFCSRLLNAGTKLFDGRQLREFLAQCERHVLRADGGSV